MILSSSFEFESSKHSLNLSRYKFLQNDLKFFVSKVPIQMIHCHSNRTTLLIMQRKKKENKRKSNNIIHLYNERRYTKNTYKIK